MRTFVVVTAGLAHLAGCSIGVSRTSLIGRGSSQDAAPGTMAGAESSRSVREDIYEMNLTRRLRAGFRFSTDVSWGTTNVRVHAPADMNGTRNVGVDDGEMQVRISALLGYPIDVADDKVEVTPFALIGANPFPSPLRENLDRVYGGGVEVMPARVDWQPYLRLGVAYAEVNGIGMPGLFMTIGFRYAAEWWEQF